MLIPKKMSLKKILQYGLVMSLTLGTTGYLIFKNFIAPNFSNQSDITIPVDTNIPLAEDVISEAGSESSLSDVEKRFLFDDDKFKKLKDNMNANIDLEVDVEGVGKKNPFEAPEKIIEEAGQTSGDPEAPATTSEQQFISL